MSLKPKPPREMTEELARIGKSLLPEGSAFRLVGDKLYEKYREEDFGFLYHPEGREAISPVDLLFVSAFQALENLSDREAAQALRVNIGWKYALHLPLDDDGFNFSVLSEFRDRLVKFDAERVLFDQLIAQFQEMGVLKKRGRQRTDSLAIFTHLDKLNRLELIVETVRLSVVALVKVAPDFMRLHIPPEWAEKYTERCVSERLNDAERARLNAETGRDGVWLLNLIDAPSTPGELKELSEIKVLRQVWSEQFEIKGEEIVLRAPKTLNAPNGGLIQNPQDPDLRWSSKRDQTWTGYKVQVTETDDEDHPHLITDIALTASTQSDQIALEDIAKRQIENDTLPSERLGDKGYTSGKNLRAANERSEKLIGPSIVRVTPQHKIEGGLTRDQFIWDEETKVATCPAGVQSQVGRPDAKGNIHVRFNTKDCEECPLREKCCTGKEGRRLQYNRYKEELNWAEVQFKFAEIKKLYGRRGGIEACLSNLVSKFGIRKTRYKGQRKNNLRVLFIGVAANLRRVGRWLGGERTKARKVRVLIP